LVLLRKEDVEAEKELLETGLMEIVPLGVVFCRSIGNTSPLEHFCHNLGKRCEVLLSQTNNRSPTVNVFSPVPVIVIVWFSSGVDAAMQIAD
jgi:hypothetical protein